MDTPELRVGDVVKLRGDRVRMTVTDANATTARTAYFYKGKYRTATFPVAALTKLENTN